MLRKLTKFEIKSLVSDCPALRYALQVLDENPPLPLPSPHPLRDEVVERVRECAHAWMWGNVLDEELDKAVVGFCYLVRNYPEHPAFDSLRNDLSDAQISTAAKGYRSKGSRGLLAGNLHDFYFAEAYPSAPALGDC